MYSLSFFGGGAADSRCGWWCVVWLIVRVHLSCWGDKVVWDQTVCLRVLVLWNSWTNCNRSKVWQNARAQQDWGPHQHFWAWQSLRWAIWSWWNTIRCALIAITSVSSSTRTTVSGGGRTRTQATTAVVTPKMALPGAPHRHVKKLETMHLMTPGHSRVWPRPPRSWRSRVRSCTMHPGTVTGSPCTLCL